MFVFFDHFLSPGSALGDYFHDFPVDPASHLFRVRPQIFCISETDQSHSVTHAQLCHNIMRDLVSFLKVISCAVCTRTVKILFSASATQNETNLVD